MDKNERLEQITQTAIKYRGEILERMSWLEKFIDIYITNYLTKKDNYKAQEMQLLIFGDNRISLESKRQIFQRIAEANDLLWFKAYKSVRKIESKKDSIIMNKDLVYVIEQRNVFAHCIADTTDKGTSNLDAIGFVKFKDKGETIWYDNYKFQELANVIVYLTNYIHERNKI